MSRVCAKMGEGGWTAHKKTGCYAGDEADTQDGMVTEESAYLLQLPFSDGETDKQRQIITLVFQNVLIVS
jgi:hypothetical protein